MPSRTTAQSASARARARWREHRCCIVTLRAPVVRIPRQCEKDPATTVFSLPC